MDLIIIAFVMATVIYFYFRHNPLAHTNRFILRRFVNWFPLGMTYAFLYMGRYNLTVAKNALGVAIPIEDFGWIFGAGTIIYGFSFLINGPLVDKIGGKKGILIAALGASVANAAMGVTTYLYLQNRLPVNLFWTLTVLYSLNMFFQSYGAVSIIKVKAYWFHVSERGIFGAIFGTLISVGVYFAFDWGHAIVEASKRMIDGPETTLHKIFRGIFAVDTGTTDAIWLVFFIPAGLLILWSLLDIWLIKDTPGEAGYTDFDTHDASSGEMERDFTIWQLLHRIFTSRLMLTFALIEFTAGVLRNGIMQWYTVFAKEFPLGSAAFFLENWGLLLCLVGIVGGFAGGIISDKFFQSRRAPPVAFAQAIMFVSAVIMAIFLFRSPTVVGLCALTMACLVITTHSLMSGTAAADFGGRKATATASGIVDGFVYLGTGLQSISLGYLIPKNWYYWPIFMAPFALLGLVFAIRIWQALPEATKRYFIHLEEVRIAKLKGHTVVTKTTMDIEV
jgi:OPA family glycerol-3-phosphate transporter-like MFS transporter